MKIENGPSDSDDDSMETDATDKQACFVLFQKFVREVSLDFTCIPRYGLNHLSLTFLIGAGPYEAVQG